ncbi:MoxR family ATPase [Fibrella sp. HMF5335]|uniref:MoxR family ATPase n=1 Tax=Fibrella rubiginis TaxID=2817060 RepID=A0A939GGU7_9BACT|nr:MoxR family ATPase [Fibrella rubiginis]MBO0938749.1 MoxR family ATPase [Fibrella rubiginis]
MIQHTRESIQALLENQGYQTDPQVVMSVFLALQLKKPLLIEGPAGVGKTEIAKVMALALNTDLIRLQGYEGLDASHALYEWNYQRQLLHLKMLEIGERVNASDAITKAGGQSDSIAGINTHYEETLFSDKFLLKRPLLQAITHHKSPVLLIDEIDRADEEFESFLLEVLSDWQITIPEIGTIQATHIPYVVVTGNRVRELSEALRRRCLYLYIDYPDYDKELAIVLAKVPDIDTTLAKQICLFMQALRPLRLEKTPGIAETLDWAMALAALHIDHLEKDIIEQTLGVILKDWKDVRHVQLSLSELYDKTGIVSKWDSL